MIALRPLTALSLSARCSDRVSSRTRRRHRPGSRSAGPMALAAPRALLTPLTTALAVLCFCCSLWAPPPLQGRQDAAGGDQAKRPAAKPPSSSTAGAAGNSSAPAATPTPPATAKKGATAANHAGQKGSQAPGNPPGGARAPAKPGSAPAAPPAAPAIGSPTPDMANIDQILEGNEEVLSGNSFTYDPGNRRDPFKSLLIAQDRPEFRGPRPEGVPGLLIDEIDLKGIFRTARGYVAQVAAANQKKSYLLKEGDQLYDGDVVSIGRSEVVFKQIVQDPTALKPFREIVKSLNPG
jgi:Tfp pilus assembly protein PilP